MKMKIFCVLLSFVMANVMADLKRDYIELIWSTNKQIQSAYKYNDSKEGNGLVRIIRRMVNQNRSMEELNLMVILPVVSQPEEMLRSGYLQNILSFEILYLLHEKYTEKNKSVLILPVKLVTENLGKLGEARRELTGWALKHIIEHNGGEENKFKRLCSVIGLYTSIKLLSTGPLEYIVTAKIDDSDSERCMLTSNRKQITYYELFGSRVYQVWLDSDRIEPL